MDNLDNIDMNLVGVDEEEVTTPQHFAQTSHHANVHHRAMGVPPKRPKRGEHGTGQHELVTPAAVAPGLARSLIHQERGHSHIHNSSHLPIVHTQNHAQSLVRNSAQPQANSVPPPPGRNENKIPAQQLPSDQDLLAMAINNRQRELNLMSKIAYDKMCAMIKQQKMAYEEMCAPINQQKRLVLVDLSQLNSKLRHIRN